VDQHSKYLETGGITVYDQEPFTLSLVGVGLDRVKAVKFTTAKSTYGGNCVGEGSSHISKDFADIDEHSNPGLVQVIVEEGLGYYSENREYYICVATDEKDENGNYGPDAFKHQGTDSTLLIYMNTAFMPVPVMVVLLVVLLGMVSDQRLVSAPGLTTVSPSPVSSPASTWAS
jgi:hypothetical protein